MARSKGTDGSLLSSLPWTLAALGVAIVPHLPYLPIWVSLTLFTCALGRWQVERRRWKLPGPWLRLILAVFCFIGVYATYDSISGVGPGSSLLAVMAALKLLETRARRDQFVLLFLSIFLIMAALLREQYVWSLPYMFLGVFTTMVAWLQMSMSQGASIRTSLADSGRLIGYAIPLMLAMWVFFPRISTPFWAVPIDTSSGVTGLSDEMSPGDISSLSASNEVAFRVRFDSVVPEPSERYWRGLILHSFNGRTWKGNEPTIVSADNRAIDYIGRPVSYEITLEPTRQHWVFALDVPFEWSLDKTFMGRQQQLSRTQPLDQRISYRATSYSDFRLNREISSTSFRYHLRLPNNNNPRSIDFARQLRATVDSDRAYIDEVLDVFSEQEFYYTLEPPALGRNSVDEFLFQTRRGFCEHYASAFAILMRAAGIPSRVVVGYQGGQINTMLDDHYLIVRQSDAHAWTEVWLEGRGWTRVDPTAAVAPERIETGLRDAALGGAGIAWGLGMRSRLWEDLTLTWDMINARWNEWVLAYGDENQLSFMRFLGMDEPSLRKMLLTLISTIAALLAGFTLLLAYRYRPPPVDPVRREYNRFMRKCGIPAKRGEAPLDYLARVSRERPALEKESAAITELYLEARYGASGVAAMPALKTAIARFRPALGSGLGQRSRASG